MHWESPAGRLRDTELLTDEGDLAARMVEGISAFLDREYVAADRARRGASCFASASLDHHLDTAQIQRRQLARIVGVVDKRRPLTALELLTSTVASSLVAQGPTYEVHAIRWPVLEGIDGEGLLLQPSGRPVANIIALPDADISPEALVGLAPGLALEAQFARHLAELGCRVAVPVLINRSDEGSANDELGLKTNLSQREFIYRMAFELGRHLIGYEVQKVLALVDYFASTDIGATAVYGYGEGGLLALVAGALDTRIAATGVSGYLRNASRVWREPIERNVWGLLRGFSDGELAALVAPRGLVVESAPGPLVEGPPPPRAERNHNRNAAAGRLEPVPTDEVAVEVALARRTYVALHASDRLVLVEPETDDRGPGSRAALTAFLGLLGNAPGDAGRSDMPGTPPHDLRTDFDADARQQRQFNQLCAATQRLMHRSAAHRQRTFWTEVDASSVEAWGRSTRAHKERFWGEVIGRCPAPTLEANPRSRRAHEGETWAGYEVTLDLWPGVFAYGLLLVPKDLRAGELRPAVVCQHGLEGRPQDLLDEDPANVYQAFAKRLVERGYVVFAPQNPYTGGARFRELQRKANPLKLSLFSFITAQHERILAWLAALPYVDADRIAFYGLSYGGKTAMRLPALLDGYCLSICSADFNEWVVKTTSLDLPMSYVYSVEYDMYEFNLAHTFNYAEMAAMIAPRPFMVERGHHDGVGADEWVAFEYAKVRRLYAALGLSDRTEIDFFEGAHRINGRVSYPFLDRHLLTKSAQQMNKVRSTHPPIH